MEYTIDTVTRLTGLSAHTLRNWEKRYNIIKPRRMDNGFRTYTEEEVALLKKLSDLLAQGQKIGDLADALAKNQPLPEPTRHQLNSELQGNIDQVLAAMLDLDQAKADYHLTLLTARLTTSQMLDFVYRPLLVEFGKLWQSGKISISQEHFGSALIRMRLAPLVAMYLPAQTGHRKVLCATLEGERHEGGILLFSAHLKSNGWNVAYFGTDLPFSELDGVVRKLKVDAVCLSFCMRENVERFLKVASTLSVPICIGGAAIREFAHGTLQLPKNVFVAEGEGNESIAKLEQLIALSKPPQSNGTSS